MIEEICNVSLPEEEMYIDKLPPNTKVYGSLKWSKWDDKLALVDGPDFYSVNKDAMPEIFDPAKMARRYAVRFATDNNGKRLKIPNDAYLGREIYVKNRSANYWDTVWSIGRPSGYGISDTGSFEKEVYIYWVGVDIKDLGPAEVKSVTKLYDSYGYIDISGYPRLSIGINKWKKLVKYKNFEDTQALESNLANAAYELLRVANRKEPGDDLDQQIIWDSIQGVYKTDKKGEKLLFILKK